jgi:hypothetical protein
MPYYPYLATGATLEKQSEKPVGYLPIILEKEKHFSMSLPGQHVQHPQLCPSMVPSTCNVRAKKLKITLNLCRFYVGIVKKLFS